MPNTTRLPLGRKHVSEPMVRHSRTRFQGATPERVSQIIAQVERGQLDQWADLAEWMRRYDPHIQSVTETRRLAVACAPWELQPGIGDEVLAEEAADFLTERLQKTEELESILGHLHYAEDLGWGVAEHEWHREDNLWATTPHVVMGRDAEFTDDWRMLVRTFDVPGGSWIDTDEERARWILHVPGAVGTQPHLAGDLLSVAWMFIFKRWGEAFWAQGNEKLANGILLGRVLENAPTNAREALHDALENLSGDHAGIVEVGTEVDVVFPNFTGAAWETYTAYLNDQVSKALLGSTLNVEVGSTGGNRALGESQFSTTILPRLNAHSKRLAGTIERDWLKPLLRFNADQFGGRVPPVPQMVFKVTPEPEAEIDQLLVDAGAVRVDELRVSRGLPPLGADAGGDRFVQPLAKAAPEFSRAPEVAPVPLSKAPRAPKKSPRQMDLPMTSRISPTSSSSPTQIDNVQSSILADLASSRSKA